MVTGLGTVSSRAGSAGLAFNATVTARSSPLLTVTGNLPLLLDNVTDCADCTPR